MHARFMAFNEHHLVATLNFELLIIQEFEKKQSLMNNEPF